MSTITKTVGRDLRDGGYLEITAELRDGTSDLSPGFSITASQWDKHGRVSGRARKRQGRDIDSGGCLHEQIAQVAPELRPIISAHLTGPDGLPMHAKANGWYFYSGDAAAYERRSIAAGHDFGYSRLLATSDHERAAQALNIPADQLPRGLKTREEFETFVDSLTSVYAEQARAAREVLESMVDGEGVES